MKLRNELSLILPPDELNKLSVYIADSELVVPSKQGYAIFSEREKSECDFYKTKEMDVVKPYKPISKLINFESWNG